MLKDKITWWDIVKCHASGLWYGFLLKVSKKEREEYGKLCAKFGLD